MGDTRKAADERDPLLRRAIEIYHARQDRARVFDTHCDLFGEPAWDILLEVYIAQEHRRPICLSDASLAAGVPLSTAQRWVKLLLARGLLRREGDRRDARRTLISLSEKALSIMREYLEKFERRPRISEGSRNRR